MVCCSFAIWPGKGIFSNAVHRLFGSRCICTTEVKDMGKLPCGKVIHAKLWAWQGQNV